MKDKWEVTWANDTQLMFSPVAADGWHEVNGWVEFFNGELGEEEVVDSFNSALVIRVRNADEEES